MVSKKWHLNQDEAKAVIKNALIFTTPAILVSLEILNRGGSLDEVFIAVKVWVFGVLIDAFRKLKQGK